MKINGEKISQIIKHFCESKAEFAKKMGETPQNIQNWINRGAGMTILEKLMEAYPQISLNWLLKDEGEMFTVKDETVKIKEEPQKDVSDLLKRIEYLEKQLSKKSTARLVVEFDVESDEFVKLGLKEKVVQVLSK